jgi:hypothetical protein
MNPKPSSAYRLIADNTFAATELTRGRGTDHQHAGPPTALVCRAVGNAPRQRGT